MHSALLLAVAALPFLGADALKCSTTARCGTQSNSRLTCKNSVFGNCCSKAGYCGSTSAYCGKGCQGGFGDCTSTSVKSSLVPAKPSSAATTLPTSSTKAIVVSVKTTTTSSLVSPVSTLTDAVPSSTLPLTTSSHEPSFASESSVSPSSTQDVEVNTAQLPSSVLSSSAPAASPSAGSALKVSTDGSCGGPNDFTCSGSSFGNCCSEYGWCGSTSIYCDAGCNAAFGTCNGATTSIEPSFSSGPTSSSTLAPSSFVTSTRTSSAVPSPTGLVSTDGACGASSGSMTCLGSQFGDCCSQYGYCGSSSAFCATGCQSGFGSCEAPPAPGKTCNVEGFANKAEYYASSFNLITTTDVATCATLCLAEPACMSYLFNPGLQNCAYLKESLAQGEFIATTGTNQFFWDRECAEAATV